MQSLRSFILVALFCISLMPGHSNLVFGQSVDNRQALSGLAEYTVSGESNDIKSARDAEELCSQKAMEMESYFHQNQDKLIAEFIESFRQVCLKLKALQLKKEKGKIVWIAYWMLPTKPLDRNAFYLVEAFDKKGLGNSVNRQFKYPVGWSFRFLEQLEAELEKNLKLSATKNKRTEVMKYCLPEAKRYHEYPKIPLKLYLHRFLNGKCLIDNFLLLGKWKQDTLAVDMLQPKL